VIPSLIRRIAICVMALATVFAQAPSACAASETVKTRAGVFCHEAKSGGAPFRTGRDHAKPCCPVCAPHSDGPDCLALAAAAATAPRFHSQGAPVANANPDQFHPLLFCSANGARASPIFRRPLARAISA